MNVGVVDGDIDSVCVLVGVESCEVVGETVTAADSDADAENVADEDSVADTD